MPEAVVDSNVLFGYRSARDQWHERATAIVEAMDRGMLPKGHVTTIELPEVLNPIQKQAGYERAVETLDFLTESGGFDVQYVSNEDISRGRALFRRTPGPEITDAITVAYMNRVGLEYIYSFDDDFDRFDGITRLASATNPFAP